MLRLIASNPYVLGGVLAILAASHGAVGYWQRSIGHTNGANSVQVRWDAQTKAMAKAHATAMEAMSNDLRGQLRAAQDRLQAAQQVERDPGVVSRRVLERLCRDTGAATAEVAGSGPDLPAGGGVQVPSAVPSDDPRTDEGEQLAAELIEAVDLADHWAYVRRIAEEQGRRKGVW